MTIIDLMSALNSIIGDTMPPWGDVSYKLPRHRTDRLAWKQNMCLIKYNLMPVVFLPKRYERQLKGMYIPAGG